MLDEENQNKNGVHMQVHTLSCWLGGLGMSKAEPLLPTLPASSLPDISPSLARGGYFNQELPSATVTDQMGSGWVMGFHT